MTTVNSPALVRQPAPARRRIMLYVAPLLLALAVFAAAAVASTRALDVLELMQSDVHLMSERLATLDEMNAKLDKLNAMSKSLAKLQGSLYATTGQLREANQQLLRTNGKLDLANRKLEHTNASTTAMSRTLRTMAADFSAIKAMRSDIHTMARKVGGSFLFRGVKV